MPRCPYCDDISTHAPRTGSDLLQSRQTGAAGTISTHAPRTGSDGKAGGRGRPKKTFQPTLPARGATYIRNDFTARDAFQPTLPARGATVVRLALSQWLAISTHAPRTGSDLLPRVRLGQASGFQPTLPARGATRWRSCCGRMALFQPTLPARGATLAKAQIET